MNTTIIETQGVEASAFDKTLKASSLDWEPVADAAGGLNTRIQMPNKKLLYRSDNRQALGIVGSDYEPTDPREFVKTQFDLADSLKDSKVVRVGFIDDRSRAFAFIRYGGEINIPKGLRKVGDPIQAYIYTTDGWDGGTPRRSRLYIERLKCKNGMTSREIAASMWVSHTSGMAKRYEVRWKNFQAELAKHMEIIQADFARLAAVRMSEIQCKNFLEKLLPGEGGRVENRRHEILQLFRVGEGNEGVSRWDAYNAVTEYVTHHRNYRETEGTSVQTNRFLGVLETDTLSRQALNLLLN